MIRVTPPPALLVPCPTPEWDGTTYRDVVDYALRLRSALDGCNGDKAKLRDYVTTKNGT